MTWIPSSWLRVVERIAQAIGGLVLFTFLSAFFVIALVVLFHMAQAFESFAGWLRLYLFAGAVATGYMVNYVLPNLLREIRARPTHPDRLGNLLDQSLSALLFLGPLGLAAAFLLPMWPVSLGVVLAHKHRERAQEILADDAEVEQLRSGMGDRADDDSRSA